MKHAALSLLLTFAMLTTGIWLADTVMSSSSPLCLLVTIITASVAVVAGIAWLPG